jgi:hypothetical protein
MHDRSSRRLRCFRAVRSLLRRAAAFSGPAQVPLFKSHDFFHDLGFWCFEQGGPRLAQTNAAPSAKKRRNGPHIPKEKTGPQITATASGGVPSPSPLLVPPNPPSPCAPELYLLPNAAPLLPGRCGRVARQPAPGGARAHRLRQGNGPADPSRCRPHHPQGRGSHASLCVLLMGGAFSYRAVVYCFIASATD